MLPVLASSDPPYFILFFALFGVIMIVASIIQANQRGILLGRVARRLGGTFHAGNMFEPPSIQFTLGGRRAILEVYRGSRNRPAHTRVVVSLGGRASGSLHILPEGFGQSFLKFFGAQDLEIGDAAFDKAYIVRAEPASFARRVFSATRAKEVIRSVWRIGVYRNPTIDSDRSNLTVQVREAMTEEVPLMLLVKTAEEFIGFLIDPPDVPGVEWGAVRMVAGGECPVCCTELKQQVGRCGTCKTPHHRECWDYMGRCSTYACKGTRFVA